MADRHPGKNDTVLVVDFAAERVQALGMVNHEMPHAKFSLSAGRSPSRCDRHHEITGGSRTELAHQRDLGERSTIEMVDARTVQSLYHVRIIVGLYRIKNAPRKTLQKGLRRLPISMWMDAIHRLVRLPRQQHAADGGEFWALLLHDERAYRATGSADQRLVC